MPLRCPLTRARHQRALNEGATQLVTSFGKTKRHALKVSLRSKAKKPEKLRKHPAPYFARVLILSTLTCWFRTPSAGQGYAQRPAAGIFLEVTRESPLLRLAAAEEALSCAPQACGTVRDTERERVFTLSLGGEAPWSSGHIVASGGCIVFSPLTFRIILCIVFILV